MTDETKKKEPHWLWYLMPLVIGVVWANYTREKEKEKAIERDKICNIDCRYNRERAAIDAEARSALGEQEYKKYKAEIVAMDLQAKLEEQATEERRSHLTDEERSLLEDAETQRDREALEDQEAQDRDAPENIDSP